MEVRTPLQEAILSVLKSRGELSSVELLQEVRQVEPRVPGMNAQTVEAACGSLGDILLSRPVDEPRRGGMVSVTRTYWRLQGAPTKTPPKPEEIYWTAGLGDMVDPGAPEDSDVPGQRALRGESL